MDTTQDATNPVDPAEPVTVHVFGGLRVWRGAHEVQAVPPRQRLILAELVCAAVGVVSVTDLVDALWEEEPPASAVNQVHRIVGQLRRMLEPGLSPHATGHLILASGSGYRIGADQVECDLYELRALLGKASKAIDGGDPAAAGECYAAALQLAQGALFGGLQAHMAARPEFLAVEQERVATAMAAADLAISEGCSVQTLAAITAIAASVPLHEALHARLIGLLAASGRRAEALAAFEVMRRRLADELGVDPGRELTQAYRDLLAADSADSSTESPTKLAPLATVPAQLPRALTGFVFRADVETLLTADLSDVGGTVAITAFGGMGGIGKTALAVHWAYRVIDRFPDGQLYVNLRGFDSGPAVEPEDAVNSLLESLGQPLSELGAATIEARSAHYRSLMAGRRMIVILDNARDADHVRPLLPGSRQCLVLVTSRNRLTSLVAREGARFVQLGRLTAAEARQLLINRLGEARIAGEPNAVAAVITGCAGLPLALSIVAARIATNPEQAIPEQVSELFSSSATLDEFSTGEGLDDIRSVFSWSYQTLTEDAARLFRLLGAHPGLEFSLASIANLLGVDKVHGHRVAKQLVAAHMLTASAPERYVLHDLLRKYAEELLDALDERRTAENRIVSHYLLATRKAYMTYGRQPIAELKIVYPSLVFEDCETVSEALAWYSHERAALEAIITVALNVGLVREAVLMVLDRRPMKQTHDWLASSLTLTTRVLDAATEFSAGKGQVEGILMADLHREVAHRWEAEGGLDGRSRADEHFKLALAQFRAMNDYAGQSNVYRSMCIVEANRGLKHLVIDYAEHALRLARLADRDDLIAWTLANLSESLSDSARYAESIEVANEALQVIRRSGLSFLETNIKHSLVMNWAGLGEYRKALYMAQEMLDDLDRQPDHAMTFEMVGVAAKAAWECGDAALTIHYSEQFLSLVQTDEGLGFGPGQASVSRRQEEVTDAYAAALAALDRN